MSKWSLRVTSASRHIGRQENKGKTMEFGKKKGILYFGVPSGSLQEQVLRILDKAGYPLPSSRQYELATPYDQDVVFRVLDRKEMPEKVNKGIVDCGITGKDYIYEAGKEETSR